MQTCAYFVFWILAHFMTLFDYHCKICITTFCFHYLTRPQLIFVGSTHINLCICCYFYQILLLFLVHKSSSFLGMFDMIVLINYWWTATRFSIWCPSIILSKMLVKIMHLHSHNTLYTFSWISLLSQRVWTSRLQSFDSEMQCPSPHPRHIKVSTYYNCQHQIFKVETHGQVSIMWWYLLSNCLSPKLLPKSLVITINWKQLTYLIFMIYF